MTRTWFEVRVKHIVHSRHFYPAEDFTGWPDYRTARKEAEEVAARIGGEVYQMREMRV